MDVAKNRQFSKGGIAIGPPTDGLDAAPDPLFSDVLTLKGVGPRIAEAFARLLVTKAGRPARRLDLLLHMPHGLIDHDLKGDATELIEGERATLDLTIVAHHPPYQRRQPYRVDCLLGDCNLQLVFFQGRRGYLQEQLPIGAQKVISGKLGRYGKGRNQIWQIVHPDLVAAPEAVSGASWLQPVYPSTQGLTQRVLQSRIRTALDDLREAAAELPEWQDPAWLQRRGWPSLADALRQVHVPERPDDIAPTSKARARLAYDELLATQLALSLSRDRSQDRAGVARRGDHRLRRAMIEALPFTLTSAQEQAAIEIGQDLEKPAKMLRLLQGDVGSGKTVVAAIAMLQAIEAGAQAALMAPTDVLVRQHANGLDALLRPTGVTLALLTGRETGAVRRDLIKRLKSGEIQAVVGTHALFQDDVAFKDLGLAVIDEQHRFGVDQRIALADKGPDADVLVMTATPIPRTLVLSFYGDIALSELREKPEGRKPIQTRATPKGKLDQVVEAIGRAIEAGDQVYWICPLVSASDELDLTAAEDRFQSLKEMFGDRVGLVHGQMANAEKDAAMQAFGAGRTRLLVATTVVEVGVDVPDATVMVIEHAERFGLAQLHQLRGRVGRGDRPSSCLLLYADPLGSLARKRLDVMRRTEDGFFIAEEDLKLRGPGEVLGTRQSGAPTFRLADLAVHADLLGAARDDVKLILSRDPELESPRGRAMRLLLRWHDEATAEAYLRSG
ncbi:MAG: ATP-dependent DNA helicase RecG [Alphaproteobacteria bacterium]|nr:ATP-dependent DNA helicase RecG [Alphaproteobacteria bacterium]